VEPGNADALAEATLKLYQMSLDQREEMGLAGRRAAESEFSFRESVPKLAQFIKGDS
jgi:glycosyltransferase involved in cell wall biosynthesis